MYVWTSYYIFCNYINLLFFFFFSSRRRHTRSLRDWSSDVCSSDLQTAAPSPSPGPAPAPVGTAQAEADPVLARVDGTPLTLADVMATAEEVLPNELRGMPPAMLMQMLPEPVRRQLIERAVTERALV